MGQQTSGNRYLTAGMTGNITQYQSAAAFRGGSIAMMADKEVAVSKNPPAKVAKAKPVDDAKFKKGDEVRIMRPESYWFQETGSVVTTAKGETERYPYTVRFQKVNYAGVTTNNFAENELVGTD